MLNVLTSIVRTGVPYLWGAVVAWLSARGLFADILVTIDNPAWRGALVVALLSAVTTAVYAVARVVELSLPKLLGKFLPDQIAGSLVKVVLVLLLGVPTPPDYQRPPVVELPVDEHQADD